MNPHPTVFAAKPDVGRQRLSDLADGRLDDPSLAQGVADWTGDAEMRRTWHAYHLIGDVLRSDDLASSPSGDAAFLAAVRQRLAGEPVVLAPQPAPAVRAPRRLRQVWLRPVVAAAGFVAVAGVVVVLQQATPDAGLTPAGTPQMALQGSRSITPVSAVPQGPGVQRVFVAPSGQMLRDARVDEYLRAHREPFAGSPAALPGGALRNVEPDLSSR